MTRNILLTIHIASVTGWLGADLLQYAIAPRLARAGNETKLFWAETVHFLHDRYYAAVAVLIALSGIALVLKTEWDWSDHFVWVGIGAIVLGGTFGGVGLKGLGAKRAAALTAGNGDEAARLERRGRAIEVFLSLVVVVTMLAMIDKWGAS